MTHTINQIPFNKIPHVWAFDKVIGPFVRDLLTIIWQSRTGIKSDSGEIAALDARIDTLETATLRTIVSTATNYTVSATGQIVRVTASATISLPASPSNGYTCAVESQTSGGTVTVNGNGKTIQGDATDSLYVADTLIVYQFFSAINEWVRA